MDENRGCYFFASYMEAAELLEPVEYKDFISALLHYAIDGDAARADALTGTPAAFFALIRPTLDKSRARSAAGRKGGSTKQNASKNEANPKQNASKSEAIKDEGQGIKDKGQGIKEMDSSELEAAEPAAPPETSPEDPPEFSLLLVDGSSYDVSSSEVDQYVKAFPAVDVRQEFREMELWCADPANLKRKTRRGVGKFIRTWLGKEQDRGGSRASPARPPVPGKRTFKNFEERPFDREQLDRVRARNEAKWEQRGATA